MVRGEGEGVCVSKISEGERLAQLARSIEPRRITTRGIDASGDIAFCQDIVSCVPTLWYVPG